MRIRLLIATIACLALAPAVEGFHRGSPVIYGVAGGASGGHSGDRGPATRAELHGPAGIAASAKRGGYFVGDTINQRVRHVDRLGQIVTIAGNGSLGFGGDGGPATEAQFQDPTALAESLSSTALYVADTANHRIRVIRDGTITTFAGSDEQGFAGDGGPATAARLTDPQGLAVIHLPGDSGETVLIADTGNNRVRAVGPDGTIRTIAGTGTPGFSGDGGPATNAALNAPMGLAFGADGLLIADSGNNRVRLLRNDGTITTVAGNGGGGSAGDGGRAAAASLNVPVDVAVYPGGFAIAERDGNRVRSVRSGLISGFAGRGGPRSGGDGGIATRALLNAPRAVEVGPTGDDLLIADTDGNRIRYVSLPGDTTLLALAPRRESQLAPLRKRRVADVRIQYHLTRAAGVRIVVRTKKGDRRIDSFAAPGRAGLNSVRLPARLRAGKRRLVKGFYRLAFTARADGATATKSTELIVR